MNDLSPEKFGILWWSNYTDLGTKRRILISDYLYQCTFSIQANLTEAKLHYLCLLKCWENEEAFISSGAFLDANGNRSFRMSEKKKPLDGLASELIDLHLVGFLRSIGSALDCLRATIVGVVKDQYYKMPFS